MLTKTLMESIGKVTSKYRFANRRVLIRSSVGFTIVELMIVMVIVAIGVALAVPTFENVAQKRQTTSEAEQLAALLGTAQSEAIKWNEEVRINFDYTSPDDWCISAATGTTVCDCKVTTDPDITDEPRQDTFCDIGGAPGIVGARQTMDNAGFKKAALPVNAANVDKSFSFDPIRGSMTTADLATSLAPRTFVVESTNGDYQLQVEVSVVGRVRICNSDATKEVPGYPDC